MFFKSTIITALAVLFAGQAIASAIAEPAMLEKRIATDSSSACQAPRNGNKKSGDSCEYYSGPSDKSPTVKAKCGGSPLTCQY